MSPWVLGAIAATAGWFLIAKENRNIVAGRAYKATFKMPDSMPEAPAELASVMPPGAGIEAPQGSRLIAVTFVAPRSTVMSDITTPFGPLKLVSLQEMG